MTLSIRNLINQTLGEGWSLQQEIQRSLQDIPKPKDLATLQPEYAGISKITGLVEEAVRQTQPQWHSWLCPERRCWRSTIELTPRKAPAKAPYSSCPTSTKRPGSDLAAPAAKRPATGLMAPRQSSSKWTYTTECSHASIEASGATVGYSSHQAIDDSIRALEDWVNENGKHNDPALAAYGTVSEVEDHSGSEVEGGSINWGDVYLLGYIQDWGGYNKWRGASWLLISKAHRERDARKGLWIFPVPNMIRNDENCWKEIMGRRDHIKNEIVIEIICWLQSTTWCDPSLNILYPWVWSGKRRRLHFKLSRYALSLPILVFLLLTLTKVSETK